MEPFTIELPPDAATPRLARRAVLERIGDLPRRDDLLLCISEVVTNAVLHAGTPRHLSVRPAGDRLLVEVTDGDPRLPTKRPHDLTSATGRGLHFLDDLTLAWGARPSGDGKVVWFEFPLGPSSGEDPTVRSDPRGRTAGADDPVVVLVEQEVDLLTAEPLRARLAEAIERGASRIVVDLTACEFLDSTGISVLVTALLQQRAHGGELTAVGAHGAVERSLALAGLGDLLTSGGG